MVPAYYTLPSHTPLTLARPALVSRDHSLFSTSLSSDEVPRLPMLPSPHPPGCYQGYLYAGPWCNHLLQPYHGLPSGRDPLLWRVVHSRPPHAEVPRAGVPKVI